MKRAPSARDRIALLLPIVLACACSATSAPPDSTGFRGRNGDGSFDGAVPRVRPSIAWSVATDGPVRSSPILVDGAIVFGSADGTLRAVDAEDGDERWTYRADGAFDGAAAVAGDLVIAQSRDGVLHAVGAHDGEPRWELDLGADLPFEWDFEFFVAAATVVGERVYTGSGAGEVLCVDAASGAVVWRHATKGRVRATPAVVDGVVYAPSFDGHLYALDAESGRELWKFETRGVRIDSKAAGFDRCSIQSSPAVTEDLVLFGSRDARFYAVDRRTGEERWSHDHDPSWVVSSPAIAGDRVVVGTSDARVVECFELASGKLAWSRRTDSVSQPSPAIAGGVVVTGEALGSVLGLELESGRELWRVAAGGSVFSSPLVHAGRVYVGTDAGKLLCLAGDAEAQPSSALRAVYYDRTVAFRFFSGDRELRAHLIAHSYETLNRANVAAFLEARIADRRPSVVVFATDAVPSTLIRPLESSLVRRYLEAGGKIVWPGGMPLLYTFDAASGKLDDFGVEDARRMQTLLGFEESAPLEGASPARPTELGRRWGLDDAWWMADVPIAPAAGAPVRALALDEHGHYSAWVREYGGREGTGFVRCWSSERPVTDPDVVLRLAEYGLP